MFLRSVVFLGQALIYLTFRVKSNAAKTDMESVLDMLASVQDASPLSSQSMSSFLQVHKDVNVAVCCTGHLRSFGLPGVYSALASNLLKIVPGNVDLFLIGHFGNRAGTPFAKKSMNITREDDSSLRDALKFVGESHRVLGSGDCAALQQVWKDTGVSHRRCRDDDTSFMQIMWLDACIQKVQMSDKKYDMIVRTRPDVGIFAPVPWEHVQPHGVSYMQKDDNGRADWFFTVSTSIIDAWWGKVMDLYLRGKGGLPDYTIFQEFRQKYGIQVDASGNQSESILSEMTFPAAIVRRPDDVECWRIVSSDSLAEDCKHKTDSGYFNVVHPDATP
mmetsp:Transcript_113530/g.179439  ORF Transcript_113530/g.179439 Transcript_113530/m.179439 type:complete len:332 (+) Transcript_113530:48-1043(+)